MGILKLFSRSSPAVRRLPSGSMTVDRQAQIVASTVSSAYPPELLAEVGKQVVRLFHEARTAQMPLSELNLHFASLQITAREMRGGAIVFLKPKDLFNASAKNLSPAYEHK